MRSDWLKECKKSTILHNVYKTLKVFNILLAVRVLYIL